MAIWTQLQVAECQLHTAIELFLDKNDLVSSITLVGASDEILGKTLQKQGRTTAVERASDALNEYNNLMGNITLDKKHFVDEQNRVRNFLKHFKGDETIEIFEFMTIDMIFRAVENYYQLTGILTPIMQRFLHDCLVRHELRKPPSAPSPLGNV